MTKKMINLQKNRQLHAITTGKQDKEEILDILTGVHPYVDWIHIREKHLTINGLLSLVQGIKEVGVPLSKVILNGSASVAVAGGVSGVQLSHLGEDARFVKNNFPMLRVGCSIHSLNEALIKEEKGADYLLFGHVYKSNSKPGLRPRGHFALQEITSYLSIPIIAIGGITPFNTKEVLSAGASGVAVLSGIFEAKDPIEAAKNYRNALEEGDE